MLVNGATVGRFAAQNILSIREPKWMSSTYKILLGVSFSRILTFFKSMTT